MICGVSGAVPLNQLSSTTNPDEGTDSVAASKVRFGSSAKVAEELAQSLGVEMPICHQVYQVLYEGKSARQALYDLMERPPRHETEAVWFPSEKDRISR